MIYSQEFEATVANEPKNTNIVNDRARSNAARIHKHVRSFSVFSFSTHNRLLPVCYVLESKDKTQIQREKTVYKQKNLKFRVQIDCLSSFKFFQSCPAAVLQKSQEITVNSYLLYLPQDFHIILRVFKLLKHLRTSLLITHPDNIPKRMNQRAIQYLALASNKFQAVDHDGNTHLLAAPRTYTYNYNNCVSILHTSKELKYILKFVPVMSGLKLSENTALRLQNLTKLRVRLNPDGFTLYGNKPEASFTDFWERISTIGRLESLDLEIEDDFDYFGDFDAFVSLISTLKQLKMINIEFTQNSSQSYMFLKHIQKLSTKKGFIVNFKAEFPHSLSLFKALSEKLLCYLPQPSTRGLQAKFNFNNLGYYNESNHHIKFSMQFEGACYRVNSMFYFVSKTLEVGKRIFCFESAISHMIIEEHGGFEELNYFAEELVTKAYTLINLSRISFILNITESQFSWEKRFDFNSLLTAFVVQQRLQKLELIFKSRTIGKGMPYLPKSPIQSIKEIGLPKHLQELELSFKGYIQPGFAFMTPLGIILYQINSFRKLSLTLYDLETVLSTELACLRRYLESGEYFQVTELEITEREKKLPKEGKLAAKFEFLKNLLDYYCEYSFSSHRLVSIKYNITIILSRRV